MWIIAGLWSVGMIIMAILIAFGVIKGIVGVWVLVITLPIIAFLLLIGG